MNEKIVLKETAQLAKNANFNKLYAPTQCELAKWLRDEHNIHVIPELTTCDKNGKGVYKCNIALPDNNGTCLSIDSPNFYAYKETTSDKFCINIGTYEDALELGLQDALKTLININNINNTK